MFVFGQSGIASRVANDIGPTYGTLGSTAVGPSGRLNTNYLYVVPITSPSDFGTLVSISAYVTGGPNVYLQACIFSAVNNQPSSPLGYSTSVELPSDFDWVTFSINYEGEPNTQYFIGLFNPALSLYGVKGWDTQTAFIKQTPSYAWGYYYQISVYGTYLSSVQPTPAPTTTPTPTLTPTPSTSPTWAPQPTPTPTPPPYPTPTLTPTPTATPVEYCTVTTSVTGGGSVYPSLATVAKGQNSPVFTFTPSNGYEISQVAVDGELVGAVPSVQFTPILSDHFIAVTFSSIPLPTPVPSGAPSASPTPMPTPYVKTETPLPSASETETGESQEPTFQPQNPVGYADTLSKVTGLTMCVLSGLGLYVMKVREKR